MENSSNIDMKQVFEQLANITKVEPSELLYAKTLRKIHNVVPMIWVRAVACMFAVCMVTELYFVFRNEHISNQNMSELIYQSNNILYHE